MRGLWDNEKPLSPALVRSALALVGGFLALCSAAMLVIAVANVQVGNYAAAVMQVAAGIGVPFGFWLGLRMLADMLAVLHRSHDRLATIEMLAGGTPPADAAAPYATNTQAASPIGEGGPVYAASQN